MSAVTDHDLDPFEERPDPQNEDYVPGIYVVTLPQVWRECDKPRRGDGYLIWSYDYNQALRYAAGDPGKVHRLALETE